MKKIVAIIMAFALVVGMTSCASSKVLSVETENGKQEASFHPVGWANMDTKNEDIHYKVSAGNVVWSVLLVETVVVPVVLTGWYLFEPDYSLSSNHIKGAE